MSTQPKPYLTPEEYLTLERDTPHKSEYFQGQIFAMSGVSRNQSLITTNAVISLGLQLRQRPGEVHAADMRVKVSATGLYTNPDIAVVCETPQFEDAAVDTLLNPTVVIEVLSPSTESYDRGRKFEHYRAIPSLMEYVLIAQDKRLVEHFARQPDNRWLFSAFDRAEDTLALRAAGCTLALADLYDKVRFEGA